MTMGHFPVGHNALKSALANVMLVAASRSGRSATFACLYGVEGILKIHRGVHQRLEAILWLSLRYTRSRFALLGFKARTPRTSKASQLEVCSDPFDLQT